MTDAVIVIATINFELSQLALPILVVYQPFCALDILMSIQYDRLQLLYKLYTGIAPSDRKRQFFAKLNNSLWTAAVELVEVGLCA